MKVLLVNGSGHAKGCTYTALEEVAGALEKNGIETEIIQVGTQPIAGCIGCNACLKNGKCFREDGVNEFVEKAKTKVCKTEPAIPLHTCLPCMAGASQGAFVNIPEISQAIFPCIIKNSRIFLSAAR